VQQEDQW